MRRAPGTTPLAVDVDALWFVWTAADGRLRKARFDTEETDIEREPGVWADGVLPTLSPACFLLFEGRIARWWSAADGLLGPELTFPEGFSGALDLGSRDVRRSGPHVLAANDRRLLVHRDGRWDDVAELDSEPLTLAWQARRRRALVITASGAVHQYDPGSGNVQVAPAPVPGTYSDAVYDEVLGGVWLLSAESPDTARFTRVEPWPPRPVYEVRLPAEAVGLDVSCSGEWLVVRTQGKPANWLYNINGARAFVAPRRMAEDAWPGAFTFANHLVAVNGDEVEIVEIPARADVRAPGGGALDIDVYWEAKPLMHKARKASES